MKGFSIPILRGKYLTCFLSSVLVGLGILIYYDQKKIKATFKDKKRSSVSNKTKKDISQNCSSTQKIESVSVVVDEFSKKEGEQLATALDEASIVNDIVYISNDYEAKELVEFLKAQKRKKQLTIFISSCDKMCQRISSLMETISYNTKSSKLKFLYTIYCLHNDDKHIQNRNINDLKEKLDGLGGDQWIELLQKYDDSSVYSKQLVEKILISKNKKCCGVSCSSKKSGDIEDLDTTLTIKA